MGIGTHIHIQAYGIVVGACSSAGVLYGRACRYNRARLHVERYLLVGCRSVDCLPRFYVLACVEVIPACAYLYTGDTIMAGPNMNWSPMSFTTESVVKSITSGRMMV